MAQSSPHLSHPSYRPDIDGLRAVAVLSVLGFHAFPNWVWGGFVGVDVFFVISGFLISTIIFENLERRRFTFRDFYGRRIKRIFPALLLVLTACYAIGWHTLLPDEYKQLGKHMAGGAGFVANFILWSEAGYFDNSAESKPLLHLWSLGIEEQFYVIWPLMLFLSFRRKYLSLAVIMTLALLSFYLNVRGIRKDSVATFYSPQTRFWELMSGSLLAWLLLYKRDEYSRLKVRLEACLARAAPGRIQGCDGRLAGNIISFAGLATLSYVFWHINKDFNFPGKWAAIPVAGSGLIIAGGPQAWVNRTILSNRVTIWFGLISYPLYLWHWPLLSFARIVEGETPGRNIRIVAVALSILLAWLTYKLVETRIRLGGHGKAKIAVLALLMTTVGWVGYNDYRRDGLVFRFDNLAPEYKTEIAKIANAWRFRGYPQPEGSFMDPKHGLLRIGRNDRDIVLFVGDSHSKQYWNTVGELYKTGGPAGAEKPSVMFADLGFPPNFGSDLLSDPAVKTIIFSFYWSYRYGSERVNQSVRCCGEGKNGSVGSNTLPLSSPRQMDEIDRKLLAGAELLRSRGKAVYFILDNPFGEEIDPHSMIYRNWKGFEIRPPAALARGVALDRTEPVRSRILRIARESGAAVIDPFESLCDQAKCSAFSAEGELMYKDYDHLSLFASVNKVPYLNFIYNK